MPEKVNTPLGKEIVLKPKELEKQVEEQDIGKYIKQEDGTFKCKDCGETILSVRRAHPIWDGPFACSGSGQCHYVEVPYCPKCEEKPSSSGSPISPKGSFHNP